MNGRQWTDSERERLRSLSDAGHSRQTIAERMERTESAIRTALNKFYPDRPKRKEHMWTSAEIARLRALYGAGVPVADIAMQMRMTKDQVYNQIERMTEPEPDHRDYKIIAVDFDGCLCANEWPEIGEANRDVISGLIASKGIRGDKLILWTCREGKALQEALDWCKGFCLEFDAVNENLPEMTAMYGNDCRKIGADEYWDDKAVNVKA